MSDRPVRPRRRVIAILAVLICGLAAVPASRAQIEVTQVTTQLPVAAPPLPTVPAPALPTVPAPALPPISNPALPTPPLPQPPVAAPLPTAPALPIAPPAPPAPAPLAGTPLAGATEGVARLAGGDTTPASGSSSASPAPGASPADAQRGGRPGARRSHRPLRGRKLRHFRRVLREHWGCADALSRRQRRALRMRAGLFGRRPLGRAAIARRLGVSVGRALRLERSGVARLRRAGPCAHPARVAIETSYSGTLTPPGGLVSSPATYESAGVPGHTRDISGVLGVERSHSEPLRVGSSRDAVRSETRWELLAFLVILSALVLAAGVAAKRSGVPPALLARRGRRSLKPLLFLDVDGVVALWPLKLPAEPPGRPVVVGSVRIYIGERTAEFLRELAEHFEIVWASGWEDHANRLLGDVLELDEDLPALRFGGGAFWGESEWKIPTISRAAGRRPAAWLDDTISPDHQRWARRRKAPTLLVAVNPAEGLCGWHVDELINWANRIAIRSGRTPAERRVRTPA